MMEKTDVGVMCLEDKECCSVSSQRWEQTRWNLACAIPSDVAMSFPESQASKLQKCETRVLID